MSIDSPTARDYINRLASAGRYHFSLADIRSELGVSENAAKLALGRLSKQRLISSPARGFYLIVPPEYRSLGSLPADQFIPALMERLKLDYYVGLLSAAQYHGAAHQRLQTLQVLLARNRPPIKCGSVRVSFTARAGIAEVKTQKFNTPRGAITVATPESTALDLAGYPKQAGGLDQVATVLSELADRIDPLLIVSAAKTAPITWSQRLGYLLELIGARSAAEPLKGYVRTRTKKLVPLVPGDPFKQAPHAKDWRLYINANVEPDI